MTEEERLFALFDDLEQQAEAAFVADREAELVERGQAEYAGVRLAGRLMASVDAEVVLGVRGVGALAGTLDRVGADCCRLLGPGVAWLVPLAAVTTVRGASARAVAEEAWSPLARLGLASALRALTGRSCVLYADDGSRLDARVRRVGADFVELAVTDAPGEQPLLMAFAAIAAVRSALLDD